MSSTHPAHWWPMGAVVTLGVAGTAATLNTTGRLRPTWEWLHHVSPEGWSAAAAWVAVAVGLATVLVGGRYAKQQVDRAQGQIQEAQAARLAQEKQSQTALETQIRLASEAISAQAEINQQTLKHDADEAQRVRREQAQPNVVLYSEPNPIVKQYIEIVVKNFGSTPAYDVRIEIDPPLKSTPNNISGVKPYEIPVPRFPFLAPGQEWRTGWDHSPTRKNHQKKWQSFKDKIKAEPNQTTSLEIQYLQTKAYTNLSPSEIASEMLLPTIHAVDIFYQSGDGNELKSAAALDYDVYSGTTWVDIKTIHDLTRTLEKQLSEQNKGLEAIHRRLAEFGTEHEGIWIYSSDDEEEKEFRRAIETAERLESREVQDNFDHELSGGSSGSPRRLLVPEDIVTSVVSDAKINDWYIPNKNDETNMGNAWRIAYIKIYDHPQVGIVYDLYNSGGKFVRVADGTRIKIIRS